MKQMLISVAKRQTCFLRISALIFVAGIWFSPAFAGPLRIVASIPDLASIAKAIGGDLVEVNSIAKSSINPHFVEVLPSYMIQVGKADIYLKVGLGLDGWAESILEGSRNGNVKVVNCSQGIQVLDKPQGKVDASLGDVHPEGNPHYWLNPNNAHFIAATISDALKANRPAQAMEFESGRKRFEENLDRHLKLWSVQMQPLQSSAIVTYHSSFAYFANTYGLRVIAQLEPFPGIPPTAKHMQSLIDIIPKSNAHILLQEPYYSDKDSQMLKRKTGINIVSLSPSCPTNSADAYINHLDTLIQTMAKAGQP